ncbi:MAG: hypothetical protein MUF34_09925 [Polyangiaceae bacterium]|nr:hypothetical protein [Polyangiaceae bacterium]
MPAPAALLSDPGAVGPLGSLALSHVRPLSSTMALRAAAWQRDLERLGVVLPFAFVHDFGLLFASPREQLKIGPRCELGPVVAKTAGAAEAVAAYREIIEEVAQSEASQRARDAKRSDSLIAALLARLLGAVARRVRSRRPYVTALPADASVFELAGPDLVGLWARLERSFELESLAALVRGRLLVLTLVDAVDLDTLQLLGLLGLGASGAAGQVDLLAALGNPSTHDIVAFSLEILPSVLETKTRPAASTFAAHGYAGLGRRGTIDSMVLTELAWDEDELVRRLLDDEVLYYSRDQARDESRRVHHLLVDASASMRGERATFARGLALATAKKLVLAGEDVAFRFFDARLYELVRSSGRELPTAYVLSFKGERGRNPTRVFAALAQELALARRRDGREPVVHLFTHAAQDVPRPLVAAVRAEARISAVFIAPGGGAPDLDYLDLLDAHWVVSHQTLGESAARAETARAILGKVQGDAAGGEGASGVAGAAGAANVAGAANAAGVAGAAGLSSANSVGGAGAGLGGHGARGEGVLP